MDSEARRYLPHGHAPDCPKCGSRDTGWWRLDDPALTPGMERTIKVLWPAEALAFCRMCEHNFRTAA